MSFRARLIRMKLAGVLSIVSLYFDIPNQKLMLFDSGEINQIENFIFNLNLGGKKLTVAQTDQTDFKENTSQKKLLWSVLL